MTVDWAGHCTTACSSTSRQQECVDKHCYRLRMSVHCSSASVSCGVGRSVGGTHCHGGFVCSATFQRTDCYTSRLRGARTANLVRPNGGIIPLLEDGCRRRKLVTNHQPHQLCSYGGHNFDGTSFSTMFPIGYLLMPSSNFPIYRQPGGTTRDEHHPHFLYEFANSAPSAHALLAQTSAGKLHRGRSPTRPTAR